MEVGPPNSLYRKWFQTAISCFGQKPRWLALWEKARLWLRQVRARELNETEPVLTCRKVLWCHQNQVALLTWDKSGRYPVYWPDGDRHIAGRNLAQAFLWNLGTCSLMLRENSKWWTHKDKSIDAMSRGGTIRSSDEVPVMGMERRDCIIRFWTAVNLGNKGGTNGQNKALGLDNGSRMNREIHVRFWEGLGVKFPRATYQCPDF